ncbi:MAG: hypothetical protein QM775_29195 [Pirellulales bacterium]
MNDLRRSVDRRRTALALRRCATALVWLWAGAASAHNPDTSYARFEITSGELTTRLTYDVVTLVKIVPTLDADGDHKLTPAELQAAQPAIVEFLRKHVVMELDGRPSDFGAAEPVGWPADVGPAIDEKDYHAAKALIPLTFRKPLDAPREDVWVQFEFFAQLGMRHAVLGVFAHAGKEEEVIFREFEPEYLLRYGLPSTGDRADRRSSYWNNGRFRAEHGLDRNARRTAEQRRSARRSTSRRSSFGFRLGQHAVVFLARHRAHLFGV